jgi:hypothetical protein
MSYIQEFLGLQLPSHFFTTLSLNLKSPSFFDPKSNHNIFALTLDLLALGRTALNYPEPRGWLVALISRHFSIPYDCLRNFRLAVFEADSEIVSVMKSSVSYVVSSRYRCTTTCSNCYCGSSRSSWSAKRGRSSIILL